MSFKIAKPVVFHTKHRAKFHEIDPFGHLNNLHYLAYFNENRWQGMRDQLNLSLRDVGELDFAFYTRSISLTYHRPVFGDEEFEIKSWIGSLGETDCLVQAEMLKNGKLVSEFQLQLVCVEVKTGKRRAWDKEFMARFFESE